MSSAFDRLPPDVKALGSYVNDALTALRETMDEGTKRNAREALDRYETLNQALIKERKRADRMEEALQTGAKLNPYGELDFPRSGYDRLNDDAGPRSERGPARPPCFISPYRLFARHSREAPAKSSISAVLAYKAAA